MTPRITAIPALALMLTACMSDPEPQVFDATPRCGAYQHKNLIGQDASVLRGMSFTQATRVVRPGTSLTEEYNPTRMNIVVDANGEITRVWCG